MNRYNTRYSVQRRPSARDARGELSTTYVHQRHIWAETPRDGAVQIFGNLGTLMSEGTLRSRTPFITDVQIGDKLVDAAGTAYYVRSVLDADGRRIETQLVLSQRPAALV